MVTWQIRQRLGIQNHDDTVAEDKKVIIKNKKVFRHHVSMSTLCGHSVLSFIKLPYCQMKVNWIKLQNYTGELGRFTFYSVFQEKIKNLRTKDVWGLKPWFHKHLVRNSLSTHSLLYLLWQIWDTSDCKKTFTNKQTWTECAHFWLWCSYLFTIYVFQTSGLITLGRLMLVEPNSMPLYFSVKSNIVCTLNCSLQIQTLIALMFFSFLYNSKICN